MATRTYTGDDDARAERVGQLLNEFLDRRARGEAADASDLLAAHPDLAEELRAHLELVSDLSPSVGNIEDLIRQGTLTRSADPRYAAELGPYKVVSLLGRGGMGIVLKAYEESLNRMVALKILRPEQGSDGAALARFEREAKAAAALGHPNIVTVHAVGQAHGVHYIAMEYVDGPSLADVIRRRFARSAGPPCPASSVPTFSRSHLPTPLVRRIFRELLAALDAAHRAGLIHRDVKSPNILLDLRSSEGPRVQGAQGPSEGETNAARNVTPAGPLGLGPSTSRPLGPLPPRPLDPSGPRPLGPSDPSPLPLVVHAPTRLRGSVASSLPLVKLADFGLARMRASQTQVTLTGSVLGTPEYMSPEQARGDADIDHRTDLYSAGVVLYEMLTGQTPFHCDSATATIHRILHEEPADPRKLAKSVDPVLASLALRLMAKRRENRPASSATVLGLLTASQRVGSPERRRRLRRRIWTVSLAVMLIAAGAWSSVRLIQPWSRPPRIAAVEVRAKNDGANYIVARYGDDPTWRVFPVDVESIAAAQLVDVNGCGRQVVAAGLRTPTEKGCLQVFDARGCPLGQPLDLSDDRVWPDCTARRMWMCNVLAAADLDSEPGEEVVAAAGDGYQYPARISIVDLRRPQSPPTFWHWGGITGLRIVPQFFDSQRPAIVAWGTNNKLDGFGDPVPADYAGPRYTSYDKVNVVMILDPRDIDGVAPPRGEGDWGRPPRGLHAYAFLDLPRDDGSYYPIGSQELVTPSDSDVREITDVSAALEYDSSDSSGPWLSVGLQRPKPLKPVGTLIVDRNLGFREFLEGDHGYWKSRWQVIVRDGEWVAPDNAAASTDSSGGR